MTTSGREGVSYANVLCVSGVWTLGMCCGPMWCGRLLDPFGAGTEVMWVARSRSESSAKWYLTMAEEMRVLWFRSASPCEAVPDRG